MAIDRRWLEPPKQLQHERKINAVLESLFHSPVVCCAERGFDECWFLFELGTERLLGVVHPPYTSQLFMRGSSREGFSFETLMLAAMHGLMD